MKKQARFWIDYKGSVVRLKVNNGGNAVVRFGGPTDEGYSYTTEYYSFDGAKVDCAEYTRARDCDGLIERYTNVTCRSSDLSAGWHDPVAKVAFPEWQQLTSNQIDHSAEAMNY